MCPYITFNSVHFSPKTFWLGRPASYFFYYQVLVLKTLNMIVLLVRMSFCESNGKITPLRNLYRSTISWPRYYFDVSELNSLAASPRVKRPWYPLGRRLMGPKANLNDLEKIINPTGTRTRSSSPQPVAVPIALSWLCPLVPTLILAYILLISNFVEEHVHILHVLLYMCIWTLYQIQLSYYASPDRLCGLVVRVLGYRSGGPGSIPGTTRKKSSGSGTGSTQPREYNWGATW
jgi:hypothetical protein